MINSKIQWMDATVNFWMGCHKVSEGCKYCYLYRDMAKYGGNATDVTRVSEKTIKGYLKALKDPARIFTCSWSDFFIEEADAWRSNAWEVVKSTPQHVWQILTKRPERIAQCLPQDWGKGYSNVWIRVTIENEKVKEERLKLVHDAVYQMGMQNKIFVSAEPLLSVINFLDGTESETIFRKCVNWLILGGESGNDTGKVLYRPCEQRWFENIAGQCQIADIPLFVKQMGTSLSKQLGMKDRHGSKFDEFPEALKIREFPH